MGPQKFNVQGSGMRHRTPCFCAVPCLFAVPAATRLQGPSLKPPFPANPLKAVLKPKILLNVWAPAAARPDLPLASRKVYAVHPEQLSIQQKGAC